MNMLVKSAAIATAAAVPSSAIRAHTHKPDISSTKSPRKLHTLIARWREEKTACDAECSKYTAAANDAEKHVSVPALARYCTAAYRDGIEKPHPDFPKPKAIPVSAIRRAIAAIQPPAIMEQQTSHGRSFVLMNKPLPLSDNQIARRERLEKRLAAAKEYEVAYDNRLSQLGVTQEHDKIVDRHSTAMWRIEKKITAHKCTDANELRTKIKFFMDIPDFDGFFDNMDAVRAVFAETFNMLGGRAH